MRIIAISVLICALIYSTQLLLSPGKEVSDSSIHSESTRHEVNLSSDYSSIKKDSPAIALSSKETTSTSLMSSGTTEDNSLMTSKQILTPSSKDQSKWSTANQDQYRKRLKSELTTKLNVDENTIDQIFDLAITKIESDQELMKIHTASKKNWESWALLGTPDQELTVEQLSQKNDFISKLNDAELSRENNRIAYEDSLKSLLSEQELGDYIKLEENKAQQLLSKNINNLSASLKYRLPTLSEYQISEITRIQKYYEGKGFEDLPIGSTLTGANNSVPAPVKQQLGLLRKDMISLLTAAQIEELENSGGWIALESS